MTLLDDTRADVRVWTTACALDRLIPGRGVRVLLDDGSHAALFRLDDDSLYEIGNVDPFSGAAVLSRGIVGDRAGRWCSRRSRNRRSRLTTATASMIRQCRYLSTRHGLPPTGQWR